MGGRPLHVRVTLETDSECWARISAVYLWGCRRRLFCMTRWLTVGTICILLTMSLSFGIARLMEFTRADSSVSDYHAHGFDRLEEAEREFVCIAGLSSSCVESFLAYKAVDDRLGFRFDKLSELNSLFKNSDPRKYKNAVSSFVFFFSPYTNPRAPPRMSPKPSPTSSKVESQQNQFLSFFFLM